jgi:cytolysin (calcineurin-like family phosphatase)
MNTVFAVFTQEFDGDSNPSDLNGLYATAELARTAAYDRAEELVAEFGQGDYEVTAGAEDVILALLVCDGYADVYVKEIPVEG